MQIIGSIFLQPPSSPAEAPNQNAQGSRNRRITRLPQHPLRTVKKVASPQFRSPSYLLLK